MTNRNLPQIPTGLVSLKQASSLFYNNIRSNLIKDTNSESLTAFEMLSEYMKIPLFPNGIGINLLEQQKVGGTLLESFPFTIECATAIRDAIVEIDCPCVFIFPVPGEKTFVPEFAQTWIQISMSQSGLGMPPWFSIHTIATAPTCITRVVETILQHAYTCTNYLTKYDTQGMIAKSEATAVELINRCKLP